MNEHRTAPLLLITDAEVFAPQALGRCQLLLGGGRILWIGAAGQSTPIGAGAEVEVISRPGCRVVPGLIDGHVHVTGGGGEGGFASRVPALPLSRYTATGVTTVIGLLGTDDCARSTRELVAQLLALREQGLSAWGYSGGYHLPLTTLTGSLRADIAFIDPLIGVGELAISDHRSSQPSFDELVRVASEAHVAGLMSGKAGIVHLHLGDGERGLDLVHRALRETELPARVWNPTHVNRRRALFDEAIELARQGVHIDLTAFPVADDEDAWSAVDGLLRYVESGAPMERVTISSDAGGCLPCFDQHGRMTHMDIGAPGALITALRELLSRDLPFEQALLPFTRNPAQLLRLAGKGELSVGADADLLILDESLELRDVIVGGRWHRREHRMVRAGTFESKPH